MSLLTNCVTFRLKSDILIQQRNKNVTRKLSHHIKFFIVIDQSAFYNGNRNIDAAVKQPLSRLIRRIISGVRTCDLNAKAPSQIESVTH